MPIEGSMMTGEVKRTDDELNLKLAQHIGWTCVRCSTVTSEGYWKLLKPDGTPHGSSASFVGPESPWQFGPKYCTDPAMRDLLQAKLLEEGWDIHIYQSTYSGKFWLEASKLDRDPFAVHATRERIWTEAAAKAWNLI